jgi:hypothetical protein
MLNQWKTMRKKNSMARKKKNYVLLIIILAVIAALVGVSFIPSIRERISFKLTTWRSDIFYFFNPPENVQFNPTQQEAMNSLVAGTMTAMVSTQTLTPTLTPTRAPTVEITPTLTLTPLPTPTSTPIPNTVRLTGVRHEYQKFNNCGPANLSMALSYWGWEGDQTVTSAYLRPNERDRNVMPYEMVDYIQTQTGFGVVLRYGGDLEMVKHFVAAGFPVLVERGFIVTDKGWMGHYGVITGYDDAKEMVYIPDSYEGERGLGYADLNLYWSHFDNIYMVIYPPERESEVMSILGQQVDKAYNLAYAAQLALDRTSITSGREKFFAWYMRGNILVQQNDFLGAAQAYDTAFAIYNELPSKPWRILWYQTGPYYAYYYTARYEDLIMLANQTLSYSFEPAIEETWIWRGRAKLMLGEQAEAISDFREALKWHPDWWVAIQELQNLGVTP